MGTPAAVREALVTAHTRGRLVSMSDPVPESVGRVRVDVVLLEPAAAPAERPAPAHSGRRPHWVLPTVAGAAVAALGGLALALAWLARWVAAHLAGVLGALAVVVVALAFLLATRFRRSCVGLHCGGCDHR